MVLNRLLAALCISASLLGAKTNEQIELNFVNTPIAHLTKLISEMTGNNFISDGEIPGNFTFVSQKPIAKKNLMDVYEMILRTKGYMIINHEKKGFFMITRNNSPKKENIEFNTKKNNYEIKTEIINLKFFQPSKIRPIIQPYFTSSGKMVANDQLSFVMITDYHDAITKIKKIVTTIDKPNGMQLHWVHLENVNIKKVFPQIQSLAKVVATQYRKPIQVIQDQSANSVIISAQGNEYKELVRLIKKVDATSKMNLTSSVITLKNSKAADVVKIIQDMEKARYEKGDVKDREKIAISHDVSLNSIILMGEKSVLNNYSSIINSLDKPKKQVYVEAQIVEINEDKAKELGVKFDSLLGGKFNSTGGWAANVNLGRGTGINGSPVTSTVAALLQAVGNDSKISIPSGLTLGATLSLLQTKGISKTLSSPKLLCLDNQESSIYVGSVEPVLTEDEVDNSTTTQGAKYEYRDIGLTLTIKPQIMSDNKVRLDIVNKLEDLIASNEEFLPTTTKREIKTTSIVNDGDSIVIAGLIRDRKLQNDTKVPFLGDIPLLGELFKHKSTQVDRVNLVVILTPTVIHEASDLPQKSMIIENNIIPIVSNKEGSKTDDDKIIETLEKLDAQDNVRQETQTSPHEKHLEMLGLR